MQVVWFHGAFVKRLAWPSKNFHMFSRGIPKKSPFYGIVDQNKYLSSNLFWEFRPRLLSLAMIRYFIVFSANHFAEEWRQQNTRNENFLAWSASSNGCHLFQGYTSLEDFQFSHIFSRRGYIGVPYTYCWQGVKNLGTPSRLLNNNRIARRTRVAFFTAAFNHPHVFATNCPSCSALCHSLYVLFVAAPIGVLVCVQ